MKLKNDKDELIELKGKVFEDMEKLEQISEIIVIGKKGGEKRILIER